MNPELDTFTNMLLVNVITFFVIFVILILIGLTIKINEFRHEIDYLNCEIGRTEGAEREHWKHKKRRLWLSLLPFYRR